MERSDFIYWMSGFQWVIFLGIFLMVYSWIDRKAIMQKISQVIFLLMGIFAGLLLIMKKIPIPENLSESPDLHKNILFLLSGLTITGLLAAAALLFHSRLNSWSRIFNGMLIAFAIALFFTAYHLQK